MIIEVESAAKMKDFGAKLGTILAGGECIELVGDVGAGKTTLTKGIAIGLGVTDNVQSPSFTISQLYGGHDDLTLAHYDFYRLKEAGIMSDELAETASNPKIITVVEWGQVVSSVLPSDRLTINIVAQSGSSRQLSIEASGPKAKLLESRL